MLLKQKIHVPIQMARVREQRRPRWPPIGPNLSWMSRWGSRHCGEWEGPLGISPYWPGQARAEVPPPCPQASWSRRGWKFDETIASYVTHEEVVNARFSSSRPSVIYVMRKGAVLFKKSRRHAWKRVLDELVVVHILDWQIELHQIKHMVSEISDNTINGL
jgi:hypothetical protein